MKSEKQILTTSGLDVGFRARHSPIVLFEGLALKLSGGEFVCFMGKNGAGKSSLIRTLAGLQDPLRGSVTFAESDKALPAQIAVVLTDKIGFTTLTVRELIAFGRYPYTTWRATLSKEDHEVVEKAISLLDLSSIAAKQIAELSDGQLQMAMIARAIAQETPVILLDEPTAHLDLNNRVHVMRVLKDLTRLSGKSILVATHELDLALQIADRIWLAGLDKDIIDGVPEDLVLDGSFDKVFQMKGFDLKTGRVKNSTPSERRLPVYVNGAGPLALWTRNALERSGFSFVDENKSGALEISPVVEADRPRWTIKALNRQLVALSIAEMIELVESIDCELPE